ncbi:enoyl-CoA hydratase/isomerase family protein [Oceanicoccus sp. KOV_DT_Chl]|uniref:enoyl-CoA hydratase/isomerase family protein n=1 Tax=Oceanicoccus sp. KOV_DT_Chl TaxID=1904639 RepID=UPI000C7BB6D1|nr:enoyl-CoA hydratase-related protein [Oceanicoccus sp. KOV_DT_Chl]
MSDFETLIFEKKDGVAKITLNRPDAANGINLTLAKELMAVASDCNDDHSVRAVLITGNGKLFCAGGDLKSIGAAEGSMSGLLKEITFYLHGALSRLARMNAPVIIAVNGTAAGAGFSLAVAGDYVLAAESAKFTMAYTAAGLTPDGSASYYLPRLIGMRKTQDLMLTNRRLTAQEAMEWGAINQVVADDQLQAEAQALAEKFANGPTQAFGVVKKLLHCTFNNGLETQLELEGAGIAAMSTLADGQEGITAFSEKRAPVFTGK